MEQSNISKIIHRFLSQPFPLRTEQRVQRWIIKDENSEEKERASLNYWDGLEPETDTSAYAALERINIRIGHGGKQNTILRMYRKLPRIAAILIPVILMISGAFYYYSVENRMIEISTAYGETKHLLLPDSSEIWLNAGTTIQYPKAFAGDKRQITLDGEAYFSVRRDKAKPFIVQTQQLSVTVLGTKFNVKAYPADERIITSLTSGKVEVSAANKDSWLLDPNQQMSYANHGASIEITGITTEETHAWMTGQMVFLNATFNEIVKTVERRFNVSIATQVDIPPSKQYTIKFLKNENLDEVLNVLGEMMDFTYQKQGGNITLMKR